MSDDSNQTVTPYDMEHLRAEVAADAGAPLYPALAEALRRAGRAEDARRVSEAGLEEAPERMAGRVSLGLALLDLGELEHGIAGAGDKAALPGYVDRAHGAGDLRH